MTDGSCAPKLLRQLEVAEQRSKLAPALSRIALQLTDHVAFDVEIVTGLVERNLHR